MLAVAKLFRTDYACRLLVQDLFGRGFDSPRLHHDNCLILTRFESREETLAAIYLCVERMKEQGVSLPTAIEEIEQSVLYPGITIRG